MKKRLNGVFGTYNDLTSGNIDPDTGEPRRTPDGYGNISGFCLRHWMRNLLSRCPSEELERAGITVDPNSERQYHVFESRNKTLPHLEALYADKRLSELKEGKKLASQDLRKLALTFWDIRMFGFPAALESTSKAGMEAEEEVVETTEDASLFDAVDSPPDQKSKPAKSKKEKGESYQYQNPHMRSVMTINTARTTKRLMCVPYAMTREAATREVRVQQGTGDMGSSTLVVDALYKSRINFLLANDEMGVIDENDIRLFFSIFRSLESGANATNSASKGNILFPYFLMVDADKVQKSRSILDAIADDDKWFKTKASRAEKIKQVCDEYDCQPTDIIDIGNAPTLDAIMKAVMS